MKRTGSAVWKGGLKDGTGTVSTESGVLSGVNYSFAKRFGDAKGTNPEELIGAAHASCFSMALSGALAEAGMTAEEIATSRRLCARHNWPMIDVTRRSIEETAAAILDLYRDHRMKFIAE